MKSSRIEIMYLLIFILALAVVILGTYTDVISQREIASSVLALFGTFLGATFAFRLNEDKEIKELRSATIAAMNRALFIIVRQHNAIRSYKNELEKYPAEFEKAFNFPALQPPSYEDLVHNFKDLEFLIESNNPNILFQLTIEQERFHQAMNSIRVRNEFYVHSVQPAIERSELNGKIVTPELALGNLGERIYFGAVNGAKVLSEHVYETEQSLFNMHKSLHKLAREMFPEKKFITYE